MKNRVLVDICGREFALITDEAESYMKALAAEVNKMINDSSYKNLRISRNDAALLICLDLCDRKNKLSVANDNMRAQITAYVEEIDTLKKQLEVSEEQLAMKSLRDKSEKTDENEDEAENDNGGEIESEEEYEEETQEQPESIDDDLQDEYADADNKNNPDDSEQKENYKTENESEIKSKPVQAKSKSASSPSSYGSYLFGSGRNNVNTENGSISSINDNDVENGGESKKREKDFESLKERFNRLQKSMSKP